jgi:hypothetical protein
MRSTVAASWGSVGGGDDRVEQAACHLSWRIVQRARGVSVAGVTGAAEWRGDALRVVAD